MFEDRASRRRLRGLLVETVIVVSVLYARDPTARFDLDYTATGTSHWSGS